MTKRDDSDKERHARRARYSGDTVISFDGGRKLCGVWSGSGLVINGNFVNRDSLRAYAEILVKCTKPLK